MNTPCITRRTFLRAAGVTLALPMLESFQPRAFAAGRTARYAGWSASARRSACIREFLSGSGGEGLPALALPGDVERFRNDFTVISGLQHPNVGSTHDSIYSFLTGAPHPELRAGFRNTVSVDQFAAERIGGRTRFPSLSFSAEASDFRGRAAARSCRRTFIQRTFSRGCSRRPAR